ncbi:transposase [Deinococcus sp. QL22]|uniref:transposase n=1 Tax=Deinococcus sp. QL22 TaxID=2939437 RepID=UPI0035300F79
MGWEKQGLYLRYLPPYAPFLNLIEEVWRKLKGLLMPRRCYNSVAELRAALLSGLKILQAKFI